MNREEAVAYVLAIIERADAPTAAAAIVDGGFLTVSELDETLAAFFDSAQPPAAAQAPVRPMSFVSFRWSPRRCAHLCTVDGGNRRYRKCDIHYLGKSASTHSDVRVGWPACEQYRPAQ